MKRTLLLCLAFACMAFAVFSTEIFEASTTWELTLHNCGEQLGGDCAVHDIVFVQNGKQAQQMFDEIERVLLQYQADLHTMLFDKESGMWTKLIYSTHPEAFADLPLSSGRFLTAEENHSELFLSTVETGEAAQIGRIAKFTRDLDFEVRTLYSGLGAGFFHRAFTVVLPDAAQYPAFLAALAAQGNAVRDVTAIPTSIDQLHTYYTLLQMGAVAATMVIALLTALFGVVNDYRALGVEKLMGFGMGAIWARRVPPLLLCEALIFCLEFALGYLALFDGFAAPVAAFYGELLLTHAVILLVSAAVLTLPLLYTRRIRLSDVLKSRRPFRFATGVNMTVKTLLTILIVCAAFLIGTQFAQLRARFSYAYESWEVTKPYALLENTVSTVDYEIPVDGYYGAYLDFNRAGAVFADFVAYEPQTLDLTQYGTPALAQFAMVNPNYLRLFPACDADGQPIEIREDDGDYILLAPEKYRAQEAQLRQMHSYSTKPGQQIRIIWMRDGQSFFTWRLDLAPEDGNSITDPILYVMTEQGGAGFWSNMTNGVLFIPVEHPDDPAPEIAAVMEKHFDTSRASFPAFGVYSLVAEQVQTARRNILLYGAVLALLLVILCFVVLQNTLNYFEQHRQLLAVQRCMGFRAIDKYRGLALLSLLTCAAAYLVSALLLRDWAVLPLSLGAALLELCAAAAFILHNERTSVLRTLKGG